MSSQPTVWLARVLVPLALLYSVSGAALAQTDEQKLMSASSVTLSNFLRDPEMTWLQHNIRHARAILIAPEIVKAGFILGGAGGRAVLFARDPATGVWRGPAFYSLATPSIGLQAGIEVSETVTLVMTERGLNSLLSSSVKVGGDVSVA